VNKKQGTQIVCVLLCLMLASASWAMAFQTGDVMDETQLIGLYRAFLLNREGAAHETVIDLVTTLRNQTYLRYVTVDSGLIQSYNFGKPICTLGPTAKRCAGGTTSSFFGAYQQLEYSGNDSRFPDYLKTPCSEVLRLMEQHGISCKYRFFAVYKSYQDRTHFFYIAIPGKYFSNLRVGQKVSLVGRIVGWQKNATYLITDRIMPETQVLICPKGHKYAASTGYKFCPIDGLPVSPQK